MTLAGPSAPKGNPKFRVAVIIPKYGLVGGGERFASEVTSRIARDGRFDVHVFANKWVEEPGSPVTFHKVPIARFPRFLRPLSFALFANRMVKKGSFDLVHSHDRTSGADIYSVHCVPHALWVRDVRRKRSSLFDKAVAESERQMISSGASSLFLPVSSLAMDAFRSEYKKLPGKWRPLYPGVDFERFSSPSREACRAEIRASHGIREEDFLVLFVGMNFEVKGLDTIIKAVALAKSSAPGASIRLLVVGRGNERKYREMATAHGVGDAVVFAGTRSKGLERYYRAADCFAMLSTFDTFGMVVLEAMAAGLPVMISSGVGAKDLVEEGVNGFVLAERGDSKAAAGMISGFLDPGRRHEMGRAALQTASAHGWDRLAERMKELYIDVLSAKGRLSAESDYRGHDGSFADNSIL